MTDPTLPPLPEPHCRLTTYLSDPILRMVLFAPGDYYTADQMRAYATQATAELQERVRDLEAKLERLREIDRMKSAALEALNMGLDAARSKT
jgi:hypothetical protein